MLVVGIATETAQPAAVPLPLLLAHLHLHSISVKPLRLSVIMGITSSKCLVTAGSAAHVSAISTIGATLLLLLHRLLQRRLRLLHGLLLLLLLQSRVGRILEKLPQRIGEGGGGKEGNIIR